MLILVDSAISSKLTPADLRIASRSACTPIAQCWDGTANSSFLPAPAGQDSGLLWPRLAQVIGGSTVQGVVVWKPSHLAESSDSTPLNTAARLTIHPVVG